MGEGEERGDEGTARDGVRGDEEPWNELMRLAMDEDTVGEGARALPFNRFFFSSSSCFN